MPIQKELLKWLKREGLKPYQAAPFLKCSPNMAYLYATGKNSPGIDKAPIWSRLLGITEQKFLELLAQEKQLKRRRALKHSQRI